MTKEKKKAVSIFVALDRSGSMSGESWTNAIESLNEYIKSLKKEKIKGTVNVTAFDSINVPSGSLAAGYSQSTTRLEDIVVDASISKWVDVDKDVIYPSGMTPLYDAAGAIMDRALTNNADSTIVVILTDGHENASTEFTSATIKSKVETLTKKGWEVIFLGANFDVSSYTAQAGLNMTKSRSFNLNDKAARTSMFMDLSSNTVAYATTGASMDMSGVVEVNVKVKNKA